MNKLTAPNGYKYTQVETDIKNQTFATEVYLGVNDKESNWKLITDEEVSNIQLQQFELFKKERELEESKTNKQ